MGGFLFVWTHKYVKQSNGSRKNCPQQKMQMDVDEIGTILSEAQLKNKQVAIQIEERDVNGYYKADTVGFIKGYDELGIL